ALMRPGTPRIDPRRAPMMKLIIATHGAAGPRYAVLHVHHLECDHGSLRTIVAEALAHLNGEERNLPEPASYRSYIEDNLARTQEDTGEVFFRQKLGDITEPTLAFGIPSSHA